MEEQICGCGRAIAVIQRHLAAYVNSELKETGLTYGHAMFLSHINKNPGCSQTDVCKFLMIDKTTTAKNIKKLETMGLIHRKKDVQDQRFYHIFLTEEGEVVVTKVHAVLHQTSSILCRQMTPEQRKKAQEVLKLMEENICGEVCGPHHT
jgi:DNA-binding MarR family transcriptional regulator